MLTFGGTDETARKERRMRRGGGGGGVGGQGERNTERACLPRIRLVGNLSRQYPNHGPVLPPPQTSIRPDRDIERRSLAVSEAVAFSRLLLSFFYQTFWREKKKGH